MIQKILLSLFYAKIWFLIMKKILSVTLSIIFLLSGCSKRHEPCEVIQARPLIYYHKTSENETLEDIARQYDMSIHEICRLNNISPQAFIVPGQKIFIIPPKESIGQISSSHSPTISVETSPEKFPEQLEKDSSLSEESFLESQPFDQEKKMDSSYPQVSEFIWPVKGKLLRRFNEKLPNGTLSEGINISAPANIIVKASANGVIMDAGELVLGFGKMVIILHDNGMISIYGHLQEITVKRPQQGEQVIVKQGQPIGRIGKTGNVRVPQLHFQLRNTQKTPVDPLKYLPLED